MTPRLTGLVVGNNLEAYYHFRFRKQEAMDKAKIELRKVLRTGLGN